MLSNQVVLSNVGQSSLSLRKLHQKFVSSESRMNKQSFKFRMEKLRSKIILFEKLFEKHVYCTIILCLYSLEF